MAERDRDDETNGSVDPETLYSKEYCIGEFRHELWKPTRILNSVWVGGGSFGKVYKGFDMSSIPSEFLAPHHSDAQVILRPTEKRTRFG